MKTKNTYLSRTITIGHLSMGGGFPVRVQSMTNTPTMDTLSTARQVERMVQAGCELVRITARNVAEARNLLNIKKELQSRGVDVPLVADIHYNPEAALVAAQIVDKVRINPGNYIDRPPEGKVRKALSDAEYNEELDRIAQRLDPLIRLCITEGTAIRVGTNHGSLSQRILERFGNTPAGMVESAMEFVRILAGMGFEKLVLSMKASDISVMLQSYRLLVLRMQHENFDFPLHLGVTEAGAGDDGIIKSACGIGPLLAEGLGDTIRVSLTGSPESELPAALQLVSMYAGCRTNPKVSLCSLTAESVPTFAVKPALIADWKGQTDPLDMNVSQGIVDANQFLPVTYDEVISNPGRIKQQAESVLVLDAAEDRVRETLIALKALKVANKIALQVDTKNMSPLASQINFAAVASEFLECRGIHYLWLRGDDSEVAYKNALNILQSHGLRRSQAEFVSCPSCGRTEYNIEKVLAEVKKATAHLTHLKIAVMGCIVNGPGEMADADYGCVGMGKNEVALYKDGQVVQKHIPEEEIVARLCELIKGNQDWKDPS